jgi:hypothetical protein
MRWLTGWTLGWKEALKYAKVKCPNLRVSASNNCQLRQDSAFGGNWPFHAESDEVEHLRDGKVMSDLLISAITQVHRLRSTVILKGKSCARLMFIADRKMSRLSTHRRYEILDVAGLVRRFAQLMSLNCNDFLVS